MIYVLILLVMLGMRFLMPQDTPKSRRVFALVSCLLLCFVAAFRDVSVGRDTVLFTDVFLKLEGRTLTDVFQFSSWVEPGFRLLVWGIALFTNDPQWLVIVTSLIIHGAVSLFLYRNAKNVYLGFFFYITMMLYPSYLCIMRQALATAVLLFAYEALKRRRHVRFFLLVLLAASFHTSALLFLFAPLLCLVPVNRKTLRFLLPGAGVLAVLGALFTRHAVALFQRLFPRYADYEVTTFDALYFYFAVFFVITAFGIWRFYYAKDPPPSTKHGRFDEHGFLTLVMLIGVVVAAMMTRFGQIQRIFFYFEVFYLIWLPEALPAAYYHRERRHLAVPLATLGVCLCCVAYFLVILFTRSALWYDALPYSFFWQ